MSWEREYLVLIDDCEARESRLTDWEQEFLSSLRSRIEMGLRPTLRQVETLDTVWEKATQKG